MVAITDSSIRVRRDSLKSRKDVPAPAREPDPLIVDWSYMFGNSVQGREFRFYISTGMHPAMFGTEIEAPGEIVPAAVNPAGSGFQILPGEC
jgi:hypothetical protein